jgi:hypothetical protein
VYQRPRIAVGSDFVCGSTSVYICVLIINMCCVCLIKTSFAILTGVSLVLSCLIAPGRWSHEGVSPTLLGCLLELLTIKAIACLQCTPEKAPMARWCLPQ